MSIKVMNYVWQHSTTKGSELLLMIALADNANEEGRSWPSLDTLAKKIRCSKRNVQKTLRKLEKKGEIVIQENGGKPNHYEIITSAERKTELIKLHNQRDEPQFAPEKTKGMNLSSPPKQPKGRTPVHGRDEPQFMGGMNPSSSKPSLNRQENLKDDSIIISPMYDEPIGPKPLPKLDPEMPPDIGLVFQAVHQKLGWTVHGAMVDDIKDTVKEFGVQPVLEAIEKGKTRNIHSWNYIRAIIINGQEKQGQEQPAPSATEPKPPDRYIDLSKIPQTTPGPLRIQEYAKSRASRNGSPASLPSQDTSKAGGTEEKRQLAG